MPVNKTPRDQVRKFDFRIEGVVLTPTSTLSQEDYLSVDYSDFLASIERQEELNVTYSTSTVKKAGRNLRKSMGDLKYAEEVVRMFRAAHQKPLETVYHVINNACEKLHIDVEPAKRLKRLETIIDKLQRSSLDGKTSNGMCVTRMNDIGGCRFIVNTLADLNKLHEYLNQITSSTRRLRLIRTDDYIKNPKDNDCGYRCLHLIFEYEDKQGKCFNIEAQIRTKKQHI